MSSNRLNFGLIGPGEVAGRYLLPALGNITDAGLVGVLGSSPDKVSQFCAKYKIACNRIYQDIEEIATDGDVNWVIISSPDRFHAEQTVSMINARKHVFIEKPMTTSNNDAKRIVEAANASNVKVGVGYHLRWHTGHQKLKEKISNGELGEIKKISLVWSSPISTENWRAKPESKWLSLAALGTHCIDLALWLIDGFDTIKSMNTIKGKNDESNQITIETNTGIIIEIRVSTLENPEKLMLIENTEGVICKCTNTFGPRGTGEIILNNHNLQFVPANPYRAELSAFVRAIVDNKKFPVDQLIGAKNIELLERIS